MRPSINVTPLIDVLLVLLIIFMVIAPVKPTAFNAKIPAESKPAEPLRDNPNTLIVSVSADGTLSLNRESSVGSVDDTARIETMLRENFKIRETVGIMRPDSNEIEKTVFIKAPKTLSYGNVAKVVDAVKSSGAEPIGLQIDGLN